MVSRSYHVYLVGPPVFLYNHLGGLLKYLIGKVADDSLEVGYECSFLKDGLVSYRESWAFPSCAGRLEDGLDIVDLYSCLVKWVGKPLPDEGFTLQVSDRVYYAASSALEGRRPSLRPTLAVAAV